MKITKIILHKFKRFSLKNINHFELIPNEKLIVLNWSNGVGKSSLLSQLNPLPADLKKDYYPEGYKEIHIEHNNKSYIITSKDGKHSILEDGVELNQGNTKKAQQVIVEDIFKINTNSLDVINGNNLFTNMSPSERKSWLTKISTVDYIYPITVYSKLLERKKELIAWKKLTHEKLVESTNLLVKYETKDKLIENEQYILKLIESFLKYYHNVQYLDDTNIKSNINKLNNLLYNNILYNKNYNIDLFLKDKEDLIYKEALLNKILVDMNELKEKIKSTEEIKDEEDIKNILDKLDNISNNIDKALLNFISDYGYDKTFEILSNLLNKALGLYEIYNNLIHSINELNIDLDKDYEVEKTILTNKISKLYNDYKIKQNEYQNISSLKKLDGIVCTNCNTKIIIDNNLSIKENELKLLQEDIDNCQNSLKNITKIINIQLQYKKLENDLSIFKNEKLTLLLNTRDSEIHGFIKHVMNNLKIIISVMKTNEQDIRLYLEYKNKLTELKSEHIVKKKIKETTLELDKSKYDNLNKEAYKYRDDIINMRKNVDNFEKYKKIREDIIYNLSMYRKIEQNKTKEKENKLIDLYVGYLKEFLVGIRNDIQKFQSLENDIEKFNKELNAYDKELILLEDLLTVLSPSKGLIAKSINSFIGVVIKEMNAIINTVWSYNMEILPCDVENTDLDYKFKVLVNDDHVIEDVSKLSSSMQEIVNLAFRLVFIKYSNLHGIPLILDEFGRTMDREHRISSFNMIDHILFNNFEQIFLVSHFEEMYGRFNNAQFPNIEEVNEC